MTVENIELRPSKIVDRLRNTGATMEVVGGGAAVVGGFGMSVEVAGAGGLVAAAGYGIYRLADRIEQRRLKQTSPQT